MLEIKNTENTNYLAKVVTISQLKPIEGADRIQIAVVDFNDVVVSKEVQIGDVMVYFPVECAINLDFLSFTNVFRNPELNKDQETKGFFEDKGRVKAIKMMQGRVKSAGYLVQSFHVSAWANYDIFPDDSGTRFDSIGGKLLVTKYEIKKKEPRTKEGKKPKVSRLIEGQVTLHPKTDNLRHNPHMISPEDLISITYKTHGTSWWVANVLVKRKLSWLERLGQRLGLNIQDSEYDIVYGSRRVVKNESLDDPKQKDHFYGYDLWEDIKNHVADRVPKGFTLYGEMIGFDRNGGYIQKGYDYGCIPNGHAFQRKNEDFTQSKLEVYRITQTNADGTQTELTYPEIREFCNKYDLDTPTLFYYGKAGKWLNLKGDFTLQEWQTAFVEELQAKYNDKNCFICKNEVPEEGVVVRKENFFFFEAYKLKSFDFLEWETKAHDRGESDIESEN